MCTPRLYRGPAVAVALLALSACDGDKEELTAACTLQNGTLEEVAFTLSGAEDEGFAGASVASIGDLTGDGVTELAVAEWYPGDTAPPSGRIYVCGSVEGNLSLGGACATVQVPEATASFGHAVVGVGDWDGDGVGDLAVGDPGEPTDRYEGAAYILSGRGVLADTATVVLELRGLSGPGRAGFDLGAGDLDGDGLIELVAGTYDGAFGFSSAVSGSLSVDDATAGVEGAVLPFVESGDLDGDGYEDLVVPHSAPYGFAIYRGPFIEMRASTLYDGWIQPGDRILPAVTVTGDLDGDALPDIALGGSRVDVGPSDAGRIYVFAGTTAGTVELEQAVGSLVGEEQGDEAGWSLARVGDLTGDGAEDLLIGAIGAGDGGGAYVVSGPISGEGRLSEWGSLLAAGTHSLAGWSVAGVPAASDGECAGALVGAPSANAAYLYPAGRRVE